MRAVGDVRESALSWFSPMGWSQHVAAFDANRWWPIAISLDASAGLFGVGSWLSTRRDLGSGLIAERLGRPVATGFLAGPLGLTARLQRGALIGWVGGLLVLGVAFGSLTRDVEALVEGNPEIAEVLAALGQDIVDAHFGTVMLIAALIGTGFTVSSVLRMHSEEVGLPAEPLLAAPLSRRRWALLYLAFASLGSVLVTALAGVGAGLANAVVTSDIAEIPRLLAAALVYLHSTLLLGATAFALYGWVSRAAAASWGLFTRCLVIGWPERRFACPPGCWTCPPTCTSRCTRPSRSSRPRL